MPGHLDRLVLDLLAQVVQEVVMLEKLRLAQAAILWEGSVLRLVSEEVHQRSDRQLAQQEVAVCGKQSSRM